MVWIKKIILLLFLFISQNLFSNELNNDEKIYFNFIDFNNDNQISISEIEQATRIIFQIIDSDQDGLISSSEISELKKIIDTLR